MTLKQHRTYNRKWYKRNRKFQLKKSIAYHKKNRTRIRARRHGMTLEEYNQRLRKQRNRCAICRRIFRQTPHIDHCHRTGRNRGLLCSGCNTGLGRFQDNLKVLQNAIKYLKDWNGQY